MRTVWLGILLAVATAGEVRLVDLDGVDHGALGERQAAATAVFYVMRDCPISNQFAPEIQRICAEYGEKGVDCFLAYVDPDVGADELKEHLDSFSYENVAAILDKDRALTEAAGATVTPEAAVFSPAGELLYRGRINDLYAALGKKRPAPTTHDLRKALDEVLAGKPVTTPRTQAIGCYVPPKDL